eukprot:m.19410 g.19410  ORF g.19410 m.19410 type:complete len:741 (+) comp8026_c0_seq2:3949-6171(+)
MARVFLDAETLSSAGVKYIGQPCIVCQGEAQVWLGTVWPSELGALNSFDAVLSLPDTTAPQLTLTVPATPFTSPTQLQVCEIAVDADAVVVEVAFISPVVTPNESRRVHQAIHRSLISNIACIGASISNQRALKRMGVVDVASLTFTQCTANSLSQRTSKSSSKEGSKPSSSTSIGSDVHCDVGVQQGAAPVVYRITPKTVISFTKPRPRHLQLAGLDSAFAQLHDLVSLPFSQHGAFEAIGTACPKGVLLHGPPGCGKTLLVTEVAEQTGATLFTLQGADVVGTYVGDTEEALRRVFTEAASVAADQPCILFIDEMDAICPKREDASSHSSRAVAQLLTLMDGMVGRDKLIVIGATNRPNALDEALRRPGRFDVEVNIPVPSEDQRCAIFERYLAGLPLSDDVDVKHLAQSALGYTGADISAVCRRAAQEAVKHHSRTATKPQVTLKHLDTALHHVTPSIKRQFTLSVSNTPWSAIGGLDDVKQRLQQAVEWPLKYADTFKRLGIPPTRGVLLYGPPGCSKTTLARAIATNCNASFFSLTGSELYSPYVGDSEKSVRDLFTTARKTSPSVIFLDEVEALVGKRQAASEGNTVASRVLSTVLNEMDGVSASGHVIVVAATNRPDLLDSAFLRAGRMDAMVYVPPPDHAGRISILKVFAKDHVAADVDYEALAKATETFTGADLENLFREAAHHALRQDISTTKVRQCHFLEALAQVKPSLTKEQLKFYAQLRVETSAKSK